MGNQKQTEKQNTFLQKILDYKFKDYDEMSVTLGVRVPSPIKERFLNFCHTERISGRQIITYIVENFM